MGNGVPFPRGGRVMARVYSTADVSTLTGVELETLKQYRRFHGLRPAARGTAGAGNGDQWRLPEVLAIAVARGLRRCGVSLEGATAVLDGLSKMTPRGLQREFDAGRAVLLVVSDGVLPG